MSMRGVARAQPMTRQNFLLFFPFLSYSPSLSLHTVIVSISFRFPISVLFPIFPYPLSLSSLLFPFPSLTSPIFPSLSPFPFPLFPLSRPLKSS